MLYLHDNCVNFIRPDLLENFGFNIKDNKVKPYFSRMTVSDFDEPIKYLIEKLAESEADKYLALVGELTSEKIVEDLKKDNNEKKS